MKTLFDELPIGSYVTVRSAVFPDRFEARRIYECSHAKFDLRGGATVAFCGQGDTPEEAIEGFIAFLKTRGYYEEMIKMRS